MYILGGPRSGLLPRQKQFHFHDRHLHGAHGDGGHLPPGRQQARAQVQAILGAPRPVPHLHAARGDVPAHQPGERRGYGGGIPTPFVVVHTRMSTKENRGVKTALKAEGEFYLLMLLSERSKIVLSFFYSSSSILLLQPISSNDRVPQFGMDVIRNWHYEFCGCCSGMGTTLKLFCCCW